MKSHNWKVVKSFVANTPRGKVLLGATTIVCSVCDHQRQYTADGTLTVEDVEDVGFKLHREPDCDDEIVWKVMDG